MTGFSNKRAKAPAAVKSLSVPEQAWQANFSPGDQILSLDQMTRVLHELQVQQIELKLQNEALRLSLSQLETDRKLAELKLQDAEQLLRDKEKQIEIVQGISATGSWSCDIASGEIWGSAEGRRIFNQPGVAGSFPIAYFEASIAEPDRQRVHDSLMALIREGRPYDLEFAVKAVNGEPARITHSVAIRETDNQGKPLRLLGFVQDITKSRQIEEQVRQMAFLDPLTALPNRRLLLDRLKQALATGQRNDTFGALMFMDLDNFKPLNDRHGHGLGDRLLLEVGRRLNSCVRAVDTVSRIGGDEFVVLLGALSTDQAQSREKASGLAEKIRIALQGPYLLQGRNKLEAIEHRCSVSIGVVLFNKEHQNLEELLKWADATMYISKVEGRNRVTVMVERRSQPRP